jgi:hypothetical protein
MVMMMYCFFGDLAGFQNIVCYLPLDQQETRINQWIELVESAARRCEITNVKLISDSIVATTDGTPSGLEKLVKFSKILLEEGLRLKLPLRGAISQGEVKWTEHIVFGKAVIDAYQLASNQNWLGVSFQMGISIPPNFYKKDGVVVYPTPLKKGWIGLMPVVTWEIPPVETLMKNTLGNGLTKPDQFMEWDYADKINNTMIFSLYLQAIKKIENETAERIDVSKFWGMSPLTIVENVIKDSTIITTSEKR